MSETQEHNTPTMIAHFSGNELKDGFRKTAIAFARYMELESINHDFREQHTHSLEEHYDYFIQIHTPLPMSKQNTP